MGLAVSGLSRPRPRPEVKVPPSQLHGQILGRRLDFIQNLAGAACERSEELLASQTRFVERHFDSALGSCRVVYQKPARFECWDQHLASLSECSAKPLTDDLMGCCSGIRDPLRHPSFFVLGWVQTAPTWTRVADCMRLAHEGKIEKRALSMACRLNSSPDWDCSLTEPVGRPELKTSCVFETAFGQPEVVYLVIAAVQRPSPRRGG